MRAEEQGRGEGRRASLSRCVHGSDWSDVVFFLFLMSVLSLSTLSTNSSVGTVASCSMKMIRVIPDETAGAPFSASKF